ncbi:MAG: glycerate kinase [Verrucomicrobiota bacterium]
MRALIAFDKFKDALTAQEACACASQALLEIDPSIEIETAPLADGGDGFCDTLTAVANGEFKTREVTGPLDVKTTATYGFVSVSSLQTSALELLDLPSNANKLAIVELAQTSGIALTPLENRSPWITNTTGLGELIAHLADQDTDAILIGLGGSSTHDLGLCALQAIGYRFYDSANQELKEAPIPRYWEKISRIEAPDVSGVPAIRIACDVDNPLTGPRGAAAIFGPQKGLQPDDFEKLDRLTSKLATLLSPDADSDTPGSGAAGGSAFGLSQGLNGKIVSGFQLVDAWTGLSEKLSRADVVITGEGRFDESSLGGKGPGSLAKEAIRLGKPAHVLAGSVSENIANALEFATCQAISPKGLPLPTALAQTEQNLSRAIQTLFEKNGSFQP